MLVYGGVLQNNSLTGEMLQLDLDYYEWTRIQYKQFFEPLAQTKACTVHANKKSGIPNEFTRKSDEVLDGIYLFGGKNAKGELPNKLRYLRPTLSDNKVIHVEWLKIKQ